MSSKKAAVTLTAYEDLFSSEAERQEVNREQVQNVPLELLLWSSFFVTLVAKNYWIVVRRLSELSDFRQSGNPIRRPATAIPYAAVRA